MKDKIIRVQKSMPPYEVWVDFAEEGKAKAESEYPGLAAFYEGFEDMHPIVREALERGRQKGHVRVTSAWTEHCFSCGAFYGFKTIERSNGGIRIRVHIRRNMPGYDVNKQFKTSKKGHGLFCEGCAKEMIQKIKTACEAKGLPFSLRKYNLEKLWMSNSNKRKK